MPASLNRVFLIGNLTRDPELRYIPSGTAVASFTIAVNRAYSTATGERKEDTCFVRVVVWGRRAEVCGEYLSKGSPVFVEGRLASRSWEGQDGQKRSMMEVVANSVQFLRPGKSSAKAEASVKETHDNKDTQEDFPTDYDVESNAINQKSKGDTKTSEDEVPF